MIIYNCYIIIFYIHILSWSTRFIQIQPAKSCAAEPKLFILRIQPQTQQGLMKNGKVLWQSLLVGWSVTWWANQDALEGYLNKELILVALHETRDLRLVQNVEKQMPNPKG